MTLSADTSGLENRYSGIIHQTYSRSIFSVPRS